MDDCFGGDGELGGRLPASAGAHEVRRNIETNQKMRMIRRVSIALLCLQKHRPAAPAYLGRASQSEGNAKRRQGRAAAPVAAACAPPKPPPSPGKPGRPT
jgi:hypothetical protein